MGQLDMNMSTADVMWTNLIHGFGFGLAYTPMAALAFSTLGGAYLTQGNAIFSLMRMMGSSLFIAIMLVVLVQSSSVAEVNLASKIYASPDGLLQPWLDQFGGVHTSPFQLFATNEIRQQATMIGYINTFHLLTLVPAAVAPLVLLFTNQRPRHAALLIDRELLTCSASPGEHSDAGRNGSPIKIEIGSVVKIREVSADEEVTRVTTPCLDPTHQKRCVFSPSTAKLPHGFVHPRCP